MILQAREDVGEPGLWIDIVEPGGVDQRVDRGGALSAGVGAREGPVLASRDGRTDLPLGRIVGHAQAAIVEEAGERYPAGEAVGDGFAGLALTGEPGALLTQP